jgi:hypothetical protein
LYGYQRVRLFPWFFIHADLTTTVQVSDTTMLNSST